MKSPTHELALNNINFFFFTLNATRMDNKRTNITMP